MARKIITSVVDRTKNPNGPCFVAGTLVHTKEGLVPIEKIKVGDRVLSRHESGEGEQSYQRVTETFVHENRKVLCVDVFPENGFLAAEAEHRTMNTACYFPLVVTANHPFWVIDKGWVKAKDLHASLRTEINRLQLADGSLAYVDDVSVVVRTQQPDLGWLMGGKYCPIRFDENESRWVDFSNGSIITTHEFNERILNNGVEWWLRKDCDRLRRTVYNLEVEKTHTYYVGEQGVWVHNKMRLT
jgi:hypothetical protein